MEDGGLEEALCLEFCPSSNITRHLVQVTDVNFLADL